METLAILNTDVKTIFANQQHTALLLKKTGAAERIARLQKLKQAIIDHSQSILQALYNDFKKPAADAQLEINGIIGEIDFTAAFLESWMQPETVATPDVLNALGGSAGISQIIAEPKGVCLFITPWNYPVLLTFRPLVSCLAAGNTVIIKPSELTPHASALIKQIVEENFPEDELAVIEGGAEVAAELLKLPFHHIFYTGGSRVGKIVMRAAAEHLASVTLELGGKSPAIIDDSADLEETAGKIAWGKFFNCGQTCIAPDYVIVSENRKDEFLRTMKATMEAMYGKEGPGTDSAAYPRMVNANHYRRVKNLLEEAVTHGAEIVAGGKTDDSENYIAPTLIENVTDDHAIMKEEIFGPVLPVMTYESVDDAIEYVNNHDRPLSLYVFAKDKAAVERVINNTTAGGSVINHSILHYFSPFLPFGGVGNSGIGRGNGHFGFLDFSNQRPVLSYNVL
jgi:aldehyde dehydrogenase (NAD+)